MPPAVPAVRGRFSRCVHFTVRMETEESLREAAGRLELARQERDAAIRRAASSDLSRREIASATGLSLTRVQQIVRPTRPVPPPIPRLQDLDERKRRAVYELVDADRPLLTREVSAAPQQLGWLARHRLVGRAGFSRDLDGVRCQLWRPSRVADAMVRRERNRERDS